MTLTKAPVAERYAGGQALSKRGPATLAAILKFADLFRKLRGAVEEIDSIRTMVSAGAEHIPNPATGQDILKSPDAVNKTLYDLLQTDSGVDESTLPTFTAEDLPKLPPLSDDETKNDKALKARQDMAGEIAQLGALFVG